MAKTTSNTSNAKLVEIIERLNPNVPAGDGVGAMPRVPRDSSAVRQLRTYVASDPHAKALLTGHIGVGKSTELAALANDLSTTRFVIRSSAATTLGVNNVDTFTLLLVVLEAAIRCWIDRLGPMPRGLVEELVSNVRNLLPEESRPPKAPSTIFELAFEQQRAVQEALGKLPKRISTGEQLAKIYSDGLHRLALRYVSSTDLGSIDPSSVARSCEVLLKELAHKAQQPVLLVIDDLDKIREPRVQESVFIDRAMAWIRLPCAVVATLPFDVYFGARSAELDDTWGEVFVLDPLPVPLEDGQDITEPNLQPYLIMLKQAGAHNLFSALQCRRLAHVSSGLPRAFVYCCRNCVRYSLEAGEDHVRNYHVDLVLQDMVTKWRGRLTDQDYDSIHNVMSSGGSNVREAAQLLRDGVLIRDGSEPPDKQIRIASWARPLVEAHVARTKGKLQRV